MLCIHVGTKKAEVCESVGCGLLQLLLQVVVPVQPVGGQDSCSGRGRGSLAHAQAAASAPKNFFRDGHA